MSFPGLGDLRVGLCLFASILPVTPAVAQWRAIRLHDPATMLQSDVFAVSPTMQAGVAAYAATSIATPTLWFGSASSATTLDPGGGVAGIGGDQLVGSLNNHAVLWQGAGHVPLILGLDSWTASGASATDGAEQVGSYRSAATGQFNRAVLWMGTPDSRVELNPAGAYDSGATAVIPGRQAGWARFGSQGEYQAGLWSGSAASFVNLTPSGATAAQVFGMTQDQQVGWWGRPGVSERAAMWHGTAESFVDMNPPGNGISRILATCGPAQVGWANPTGFAIQAGIWFGTPDSFMSLRPYLPPGYGISEATSVAFDGQYYHVGGWAVNTSTGRDEAFLWVGVPAPAGGLPLFAGLFMISVRRRR